MKNRYSALFLAIFMAFCTACSTHADASAWLSVGGKNEKVLAASADGACFLLGKELPMTIPPYRNLRLSVLDKTTGASRALYFAEDPYLEFLAYTMLYLRAKMQDEAARTALIEENGGAAAAVMRAGWQNWPRLVGTGGNYMLLYSAEMPCYARVDMHTGGNAVYGCFGRMHGLERQRALLQQRHKRDVAAKARYRPSGSLSA